MTENDARFLTPQPVIPLYRPDLSGKERRYVSDCMDAESEPIGEDFIARFECTVAALTGATHAVAVCNGTAALHLALHCLGFGPGDEIIVPSLTHIASVNTIVQTGATPIFSDVRSEDWLLDPVEVERKLTPRTKAILAVHLYGAACDMEALRALAGAHGVAIVESCAGALGTTLGGRHVGRWGEAATFSFSGGKTITTGEGGMVITDSAALARRLRQVRGQGHSALRQEVMSFDYRMAATAAAIGVAQMERIEHILTRKREIAASYRERLARHTLAFQVLNAGMIGSEWLVSLLLPRGTDRDLLIADMAERWIEVRPVSRCAHHTPMYRSNKRLPVAEDIAARGISLPSFPTLTEQDLERVIRALDAALRTQGHRPRAA